MEQLVLDIMQEIRAKGHIDAKRLDQIIQAHNRKVRTPTKHYAKKHIWPYCMRIKAEDPARWRSWNISEAEEHALQNACQMKPRRTASGVATITVLTRPAPCQGNCIYCPNDVRMPKSYLHNEPACQRAERTYFDPYLQVASRLAALERMGHDTDKIELIVLGGTFTDYPQGYQTWYIHELFRALNDAEEGTEDIGDVFACTQEQGAALPSQHQGSTTLPPARTTRLVDETASRIAAYSEAGIPRDSATCERTCAAWQCKVDVGEATYNEAVDALYGKTSPWQAVRHWQTASTEELARQQAQNECAKHRVVGLVVETHPQALDAATLAYMRTLGCTKLQMGVQTLDTRVAAICARPHDENELAHTFELVRAFGFKSHAHFMVNLPGATPESDIDDYHAFVHHEALAPDEVKLYPCVLIKGTKLETLYQEVIWSPYTEETLTNVLAHNVLTTPQHTRISRMIRDFSSDDIVAGNKKGNLRQLVEMHVASLVEQGAKSSGEIRMREIATSATAAEDLSLEVEAYRTTNTREHFLQWVTPAGNIAGFLRLSLPDASWVDRTAGLPVRPGEAMIREVHVYGAAARLHSETTGAQHQGLGRTLVEKACEIARDAGYERINVISSVGTREYYRSLGFEDGPLYQHKELVSK